MHLCFDDHQHQSCDRHYQNQNEYSSRHSVFSFSDFLSDLQQALCPLTHATPSPLRRIGKRIFPFAVLQCRCPYFIPKWVICQYPLPHFVVIYIFLFLFCTFQRKFLWHTILHTKVASLLSSLFRFSFYYAERETHLILNITHRTLPFALYAFPQPARPFLTGLKEYTPLLHAP